MEPLRVLHRLRPATVQLHLPGPPHPNGRRHGPRRHEVRVIPRLCVCDDLPVWRVVACIVCVYVCVCCVRACVNLRRDVGYEYINVDDCWLAKSRAPDGTLQPDPKAPIAHTAHTAHTLGC
jgi:hypothetical protein